MRVGAPAHRATVADDGRGADRARSRRSKRTSRWRKDVPEDVLALGRRAGELRDDLRFLLRADDPDFVYFLEIARPRRRSCAPRRSTSRPSSASCCSIACDATVLTSATLTVDGSFDYVRGPARHRPRAARCGCASEFDYARQAILYLPRACRIRARREFAAAAAREVVEILKRTARPRVRAVHELRHPARGAARSPRRRSTYPILVQGTAPRSALLRDFKATPNAVLLATSSFWQGVDVVGEALSCVIIDKLPFASPGDPITAARIEAITRARRLRRSASTRCRWRSWRCSRDSAGCSATGRTAACWPSSTRACGRWATAGGSSRRCRRRRSRTTCPTSSGSSPPMP